MPAVAATPDAGSGQRPVVPGRIAGPERFATTEVSSDSIAGTCQLPRLLA